MLTVRF